MEAPGEQEKKRKHRKKKEKDNKLEFFKKGKLLQSYEVQIVRAEKSPNYQLYDPTYPPILGAYFLPPCSCYFANLMHQRVIWPRRGGMKSSGR